MAKKVLEFLENGRNMHIRCFYLFIISKWALHNYGGVVFSSHRRALQSALSQRAGGAAAAGGAGAAEEGKFTFLLGI